MTALRTLLLGCLLGGVLVPGVAGAEPPRLSADIGPQPVSEALAAFGRQTGLQIIYVSTIAETQLSPGASAGLAAPVALAHLLEHTGLQFEFLNERTVRIFASAPAARTPPLPRTARAAAQPHPGLEEVVVTATRRAEPQSKVPIDMVTWTQEALETSGIKGITELANLTPGVQFGFDSFVGSDLYTTIAIRGVLDRRGTTVGVYLDDVQLPAAHGNSYFRSFPVAFDAERIEVLRGPQSVLLGENTEGGALRFITNQPSLTTFSGFARGEWAATEYGAESYEAGVALGGPVIRDAVGFRLGGWYRTDGGYVDRIDSNSNVIFPNSNRYVSESARAALLIAPSESMQFTPQLAYLSLQIHDPSVYFLQLSHPASGIFRNNIPAAQPLSEALWIGSLKVAAGVSGAHLDALSSYVDRTTQAPFELGEGPSYDPYKITRAANNNLRAHVFSQEVRLSSAVDAPNHWIAGAFYSTGHHVEANSWQGSPPSNSTDTRETQLALFGQLDFKVRSRLTATVGARVGRDQYDAVTEQPPLQRASSVDNWVAPKFVLSYQPNYGTLIYLSAAKGYRSAGAYAAIPYCQNVLQAYAPGSAWSYEIGTKNELSGGRVRLDASAFHVRWNNGQPVQLGDPCNNADDFGTATSNGFDLAMEALLSDRLNARLAVAYADARYTQTVEVQIPDVGNQVMVRRGDVVGAPPAVASPWTVTAAIDRDFFLGDNVVLNFRLEDVFRSHNPGPYMPGKPWLVGGGPPVDGVADPATNELYMRATMRWTSFEAAIFVNNALGAQPILARQLSDARYGIGAGQTFRPRTAGLTATWRF